MLYWAMVFMIIALVAALLPGAGFISGAAAQIAWILFVVFLVLFLVSLVAGGVRRPIP